jgi:hypothetical protein
MTRSPAIIRAGDVVELSTGVSVLSGAEIREAAYGAQLPVRQPPRSGNSCPTPAIAIELVRGTSSGKNGHSV